MNCKFFLTVYLLSHSLLQATPISQVSHFEEPFYQNLYAGCGCGGGGNTTNNDDIPPDQG